MPNDGVGVGDEALRLHIFPIDLHLSLGRSGARAPVAVDLIGVEDFGCAATPTSVGLAGLMFSDSPPVAFSFLVPPPMDHEAGRLSLVDLTTLPLPLLAGPPDPGGISAD